MAAKSIVIGLTGPTGAGKSTVSRAFVDRGCAVIDADQVAREVSRSDRDCLRELAEAFGKERPVALVKELTKLHERVVRTTLGEAAEYFVQEPPKGEFVLILEGKKEEKRGERSLEGAVSLARELSGGGMSLSEAARTAAQRSGFRKGEIYKALLEDNGEEKP